MSDSESKNMETLSPGGVLHGVSGRTYVVRGPASSEHEEVEGVYPDVVETVHRRGVENLSRYFHPKLRDIDVDPLLIHNMVEAISVIRKAIVNKKKIGIIGDYDVDGATSVAQMVLYFRAVGIESEFIIPQRMTDGYGANDGLVDRIADEGCPLLLILDSGTVSHGPISHARSRGLEVIVVDHHKTGDGWVSPDAIVINPHQPADTSGLTQLCTAGLVMFLLMALNRLMREEGATDLPDLISYMGLTALGTVADIMPLTGVNRVFVMTGLKVINRTPGLAALLEAVRLKKPPVASDLGFYVGPCINAGGRIGDCMQGAVLLTTEDEGQRLELAASLVAQNAERGVIQKRIEAEVYAQLGEPDGRKLAIARSEDWHPGIVGVVASKVKSRHDCPAIVIGTNGKGSGRSAHGFDLGSSIIEARELGLLKAGGGHQAAVGLTVCDERYDEFLSFMAGRAEEMTRKDTVLDLEIRPESIRMDYVEAFNIMEPTGTGNPSPEFLFVDTVITQVKEHRNGHLSLEFRDKTGYRFGGWLFNVAGSEIEKVAYECLDREARFVGTLGSWNGRPSLKLSDIIRD